MAQVLTHVGFAVGLVAGCVLYRYAPPGRPYGAIAISEENRRSQIADLALRARWSRVGFALFVLSTALQWLGYTL